MSERDALDKLLIPCTSDSVVPGDLVFFNDTMFKGMKRRALLQTTVALCLVLSKQEIVGPEGDRECCRFNVIVVKCYTVSEEETELRPDTFQILHPGDIGEVLDHYGSNVTWRLKE